jgi:hypothetical protein
VGIMVLAKALYEKNSLKNFDSSDIQLGISCAILP